MGQLNFPCKYSTVNLLILLNSKFILTFSLKIFVCLFAYFPWHYSSLDGLWPPLKFDSIPFYTIPSPTLFQYTYFSSLPLHPVSILFVDLPCLLLPLISHFVFKCIYLIQCILIVILISLYCN